MKLFDYYRSSASYRVRIALHYKKIDFKLEHINLVDSSHLGVSFTEKNPQQLVPLLEDEGKRINQSLTILEYMEEKYPNPALLPENLDDKLAVKAFALETACEIHPLNNLRVLKDVYKLYSKRKQQGDAKRIKGIISNFIEGKTYKATKSCQKKVN